MSSEVGEVGITLVVDDAAIAGLVAEHGFAVWVECWGRRLLVDTGQGPALLANASALGIPLAKADSLILSHGHYDHTGGLPAFIASAPAASVYQHPRATAVRHAVRDGMARAIGMPAPARAALAQLAAGRLQWVGQALELAPGIGLTGPIPRLTDYEDTGGPFFLDEAGRHPDPIEDDLALWLRTPRGLVVILGCGHAGLINTLTCARRLSGSERLHAVLGGFHLGGASESRLMHTAAALRTLEPDLVVPCHCTGAHAIARFREALGERVVPGAAGMRFRLGIPAA